MAGQGQEQTPVIVLVALEVERRAGFEIHGR